MLAQVHPDLEISDSGLIQVNQLITDMATTLISQEVNVSTLSIQSAVRLVISGELSKHAVSEGTKAVTRYNSYKPVDSNSTKLNISKVSGLQIEIETVEKMVRSQIKESQIIDQTTSIYLGAVLEYLMAEILELAGNSANNHNKIKITQLHIDEAIKADEELNQVFINKKPVIVDPVKLKSNTKIPIKFKSTNKIASTEQLNYPHLFHFIKDNMNELFIQKWGITDHQIIEKSKELFADMDQDPTKNKESEADVDDENLPLNVLDTTIRRYVSTIVDVEGLCEADTEHLKFLHESAILAYIEDGGKSVKWIDFLDKNDIIVVGLNNYIENLN